METIYEQLKIIAISNIEISKPLEYDINDYKLKINKKDLNYIYLELEGNDVPILLTPVKAIFLLDNIFIEYTLFSSIQFNNENNKEYQETVNFTNYN